jgi:hypothetical protein
MCDKRDRSGFVGVILVPFDGTFQSRRDEVPVLIQTDLIQNWKNGSEFLFLDTKDDVADLKATMSQTRHPFAPRRPTSRVFDLPHPTLG